jgi:hypothetical protein
MSYVDQFHPNNWVLGEKGSGFYCAEIACYILVKLEMRVSTLYFLCLSFLMQFFLGSWILHHDL